MEADRVPYRKDTLPNRSNPLPPDEPRRCFPCRVLPSARLLSPRAAEDGKAESGEERALVGARRKPVLGEPELLASAASPQGAWLGKEKEGTISSRSKPGTFQVPPLPFLWLTFFGAEEEGQGCWDCERHLRLPGQVLRGPQGQRVGRRGPGFHFRQVRS